MTNTAFKNPTIIRNSYQIETAEGIDIDICPAGIASRSYAFTIDFSIRICILIAASILFSYLGDFGLGLFLISLFLVEWFYPVLFEITKGATPGKTAFNLRVVYDNGLPISFSGSLTRNLFRFIDILPFAYATGAICMLLNKQNKRLGDIIAGTTVVYIAAKPKPIHFAFEKDVGDIPIMTNEEQKFVIAFAHRAKYLSKQRQIELANVLAPVIKAEGQAAVIKLKSIAALLIGKV